jgi:cytochrome P450
MPAYFLALWRLLAEGAEDSPAGNLCAGVKTGAISRAEAIVVAVQLMVNMTTANALMNVFHAIVNRPAGEAMDAEKLIADSLHLQTPLMRNPRRAKRDVIIDGLTIPKDALVVVLLAAGNSKISSEQSLSFGTGIHACLGRHLVMAEMRLFVSWQLEQLKSKSWKPKSMRRLTDVDVGNFGFSEYQGSFN